MNFNFRQMKPVIEREFDAVFDPYPTDLGAWIKEIPEGGDSYARKRMIVEGAAEHCPVHLIAHFPFAYEIDMGEPRDVCFFGVGNECFRKSGVDFSPLYAFRSAMSEHNTGSFTYFTDFLHGTLNHDKLLREGFRGVYETCVKLNETEQDAAKKEWRELVMSCCKSVEKIGLRLRALARERLQNAQDEDERYNMNRIAQSVNTPWEAPVTMFDALNSILCAALFISGMDGVEMNAYGQLDRLIEPFYQRDLAAGRITEEEALFLIQCFLHKTDMHCHFNDERRTYDNGVSVAIGGTDMDGKPVYNEITKMVIRAYTEHKLINPKLNARASSQSPREYIEKLAELSMTGNNNLVVENDDYIVPMFERMGLSLRDARRYIGNGCQEVICPNQMHSRAFVYLNMPQMLLHTLQYSGNDLPEGLDRIYRTGKFEKADFEALYRSFLANLRSCIQAVAEEFAPYEAIQPQINPQPMLSAFSDDCVARGIDMSAGGARYNNKTFSLVGFGTLCDSLLSLRRAYEAGTQDELAAHIAANFEDAEPLRRALQNSSDRFGHSEAADAFARSLAEDLAQVSRGVKSARGIEWRTSLFTHYRFDYFGRESGATPDGRRAGEPFSRQMNMANLPDLTAAAISLSALCDADFNDVGMFDFTLPCAVSDTEKAKQAYTDYIRTCIALRLPVVQPNIVDVKTLQEERACKGTHPDLVVRVCGYSAIFSGLSEHTQDEIISRMMDCPWSA